MSQHRVLLAGASGLVGGHLARLISTELQRTGGELLLPLRKPQTALACLPCTRVLHWPPLGLPSIDTAVCALGTTMGAAGSQAAFKAVDLDTVVTFATAAKAVGANKFGLVSALGADAQSAVFYNRIKGEAEEVLSTMGFGRLVIAQPSLLLGARIGLDQAPRRGEALAQRLAPMYSWALPRQFKPISADHVAAGLWRALQTATPGVTRLRSDQLADLAQR